VFGRPPRPFIGPAGEELDSCLEVAGILRQECYVTNVIKDLDHPLSYYLDLSGKAPIVSTEGKLYLEILKEELAQCSANVIVAAGNVPLFALTGRFKGITRWHGSVLESTLLPGRKVIPIIHPATIIPPKNQYLNRYIDINDLHRAKTESSFKEIKFRSRDLKIKPTFHEAMSFLSNCKDYGLKGYNITYDIEISNEEVSCISFCWNPFLVMSIPFVYECGDYFLPDQEYIIWKEIASILEDSHIMKCGQNLGFDSHFLFHKYGISTWPMKDTMIAYHTLLPEFKKGLNDICANYIPDIPYYKEDGKFWLKGIGSWEKGWQYNCLDSAVCSEVMPILETELKHQDNTKACERQTNIIPVLTYMQERGILCDVEGIKLAAEKTEKEITLLQAELDGLAGRSLNVNSNPQMVEFFYKERKYTEYKKRRTDPDGHVTFEPSVDVIALKRLVRQGIHEAVLVKKIRGLRKRLSTYMDISAIDVDSRLRCAYNPAGTKFSRLSSSKNIFEKGTNMQNWPHDLLAYMKPDVGYVYYDIDLAQAENRIVAYVGNVIQMIQAFEEGIDLHKLTAALIFSKPLSQISDEPGSSDLGNGEQSERFWGKKANHSLNYDETYKGFALIYEIMESEARWIVDRYHMAYPGVRLGFHRLIQSMLRDHNRTITNLLGRKTKLLGEWNSKLLKMGYSCIPQGSVGDIINERGLLFMEKQQDIFRPVEILKQVHDSIGFQVPINTGWTKHAEILIALKQSLEQELQWDGRTFSLPADISMGLTLMKEQGVEFKHKKFPKTQKELTEQLEAAYLKLKGQESEQ
jgi:uracil-DNA glycosylase family 4